ncbi:glycosyltransferase family 2 protein [Acidipila sp. EB88]|nr:glycosyltransferase family 2 protein [Acidipila sp. EB88]
MISTLILTRNEEQDLPACLQSVACCDDVHVFDSCSTDNTCAIARAFGAHVHQRAFDSYAAQRNAALDTVPFRHPWVLVLDADERINPELWTEATAAVAALPLSDEPPVAAFRIRRHDHFFNRPLRHAQILSLYPRLVRLGRVRYTRAINEFLETDGETRTLRGSFQHYPFSKGLARWFEKHNQYSSMEAEIVADRAFRGEASLHTALLHPDFHTRHRARKAIFYLLPARPLVRWLYILVARGGLLDGTAGIAYATLQAFYEWQIVLKTRERLAASMPTHLVATHPTLPPAPAAAVATAAGSQGHLYREEALACDRA